MPPDAKNNIAGLYTLLSKLRLEEYLSSPNFTVFCKEHDLADTWKEHVDSSRDRPDLYGKDITKNAFILFFQHLFQTRPREFLVLLTAFLQDFREWNPHPLPVEALKKECAGLGFPDKTVEDEFLKIGI
jgi:hypothetical protein